MDWVSIVATRFAKWAAYSDYCMNSDFGLPHCRTFWVWAGVLGSLAVGGLIVYVVCQFAKGGREKRAGESGGGETA